MVLFQEGNSPDFMNNSAKPTLVEQLLKLLPLLDGTSVSMDNILDTDDPDDYMSLSLLDPLAVDAVLMPGTSSVEQCVASCRLPVPILSVGEVSSLRLQHHLHHMPRYLDRRGACPLHSKLRKSHYWCTVCGVPLHATLCFELFHSLDCVTGVDLHSVAV